MLTDPTGVDVRDTQRYGVRSPPRREKSLLSLVGRAPALDGENPAR